MIVRNKYIIGLLTAVSFIVSSCENEAYELGELRTPSNLQISYVIAGADDTSPGGDGSGMVDFTGSADNAITTIFDFGDGKDIEVAPGGKISHQFTLTGLNSYNVTMHAVGTGGLTSSKTIAVEVISSFTDAEVELFLTGGDSKTWYWAADQPGHLGIGPDFVTAGDDQLIHTWPNWWSAPPFDKQATCLYDGEFVFALDGTKVTFEHKNVTEQAFFQGDNLDIVGGSEEGCYPYDFTGVKNVSFGPSSSIATIDGQYRGTSFFLSDGGFMGFYVGSSSYEIIDITENILEVRVESVGNPDHAWYHTFTNVKPTQ